MRPARLENLDELLGLPVQRRGQGGHLLCQRSRQRVRREAHRGRDHVVRRLRHVDVVVRMDEGVVALLPAHQLAGPVRDHLVHVHVKRRARARLVRVDHELVVVLPGQDLLGGRHDRVCLLAIENAELGVGPRRGDLDPGHRAHHFHVKPLTADREVGDGARGLDAVVGVGRDLEGAQGIFLGPGRLRARGGLRLRHARSPMGAGRRAPIRAERGRGPAAPRRGRTRPRARREPPRARELGPSASGSTPRRGRGCRTGG